MTPSVTLYTAQIQKYRKEFYSYSIRVVWHIFKTKSSFMVGICRDAVPKVPYPALFNVQCMCCSDQMLYQCCNPLGGTDDGHSVTTNVDRDRGDPIPDQGYRVMIKKKKEDRKII